MDITTTSLEALIQRATCNQNQCPDTAAIEAFCGLINKEPEYVQTATRFITAKVHSLHEWEALQALHVLEACMNRCGSIFHAEIGKFRFLNELIKLVSPKYNGAHTPEPVKRRVLELMQSWTVQYSKEFKIKEAYEMLKKQGVVKEELMMRMAQDTHKSLDQTISPSLPSSARHQDTIFQDTEKNRLLQKLLQSKNPDDLQAANRLIKTMVKEDERRVEMKSRHLSELEAAHNNARLLNEMLDSYEQDRAASSAQDLELINELQASCLRFRPNVQQLLSQVHDDERLFNEMVAANEELGDVLDKYTAVVFHCSPAVIVGSNLLDLSSPAEESHLTPTPTPAHILEPDPADAVSLLCDPITDLGLATSTASAMSAPLPHPFHSSEATNQPVVDFASLGDIFSPLSQPLPPSVSSRQPVTADQPVAKCRTGLEELDAISESLLKQSLPSLTPVISKTPMKVPMNQLPLSNQASPSHFLQSSTSAPSESVDLLVESPQVNGNASTLHLTPEPETWPSAIQSAPLAQLETETDPNLKRESVKPLGDITVPLESIKPGRIPPLTVLEDRGVSVIIHFAQDSPRPDVSVYVVTTSSKSQFPIMDYLFQAIVPKGCKLRLQQPSSTELPAHNPFLPPAAITQVMLIASPTKEPIVLRVVASFTMDDETVTEMKEVLEFPLLNS